MSRVFSLYGIIIIQCSSLAHITHCLTYIHDIFTQMTIIHTLSLHVQVATNEFLLFIQFPLDTVYVFPGAQHSSPIPLHNAIIIILLKNELIIVEQLTQTQDFQKPPQHQLRSSVGVPLTYPQHVNTVNKNNYCHTISIQTSHLLYHFHVFPNITTPLTQ